MYVRGVILPDDSRNPPVYKNYNELWCLKNSRVLDWYSTFIKKVGNMKKNQLEKKPNFRMANMFGELYTPDEVAKYFKVAPSTVYNWAKTGKIEGHVLSHGKRKSTVRFDRDQIQRLLKSQKGSSK
jgi:excisionase family DNA binding protein